MFSPQISTHSPLPLTVPPFLDSTLLRVHAHTDISFLEQGRVASAHAAKENGILPQHSWQNRVAKDILQIPRLSNVQCVSHGPAQSSVNICVTNNIILLAIKWNHAFCFFLMFSEALETQFRDIERTKLATPNLAVTDVCCLLGLSGFPHCYEWYFWVSDSPVVPGIGEGCLPSEVS